MDTYTKLQSEISSKKFKDPHLRERYHVMKKFNCKILFCVCLNIYMYDGFPYIESNLHR